MNGMVRLHRRQRTLSPVPGRHGLHRTKSKETEDKQKNIKADEIRKATLELIEKITTSHKVLAGVKAAEMMRLNELKTQAILGYINGVCALAKRVTEGEENDQKRNA